MWIKCPCAHIRWWNSTLSSLCVWNLILDLYTALNSYSNIITHKSLSHGSILVKVIWSLLMISVCVSFMQWCLYSSQWKAAVVLNTHSTDFIIYCLYWYVKMKTHDEFIYCYGHFVSLNYYWTKNMTEQKISLLRGFSLCFLIIFINIFVYIKNGYIIVSVLWIYLLPL